MRILVYNIKLSKNLIDEISKKYMGILDIVSSYEDVCYYVSIRNYDYMFIYYEQSYKYQLYTLAREMLNRRTKVFIFGDFNRIILKEVFGKYNDLYYQDMGIKNLTEYELLSIIKEHETTIIEYEDFIIHIEDKKVFLKYNNKIEEIKFKKKLDFYVFLYFIRNIDKKLNIRNLLDAIFEEPEFTKDSIVESSIASLRTFFKIKLSKNPIKAFKKVGYSFSL